MTYLDEASVQKELSEAGYDPNKVKKIYDLPNLKINLFLAANLNSDKKKVEALKGAFKTLK